MASAAGNSDGEAYHNTVFITTSLDTRLVTTVSCSESVSDFKERIVLEHRQCFPAFGNIEIHNLKVKQRGFFYHLSDSMLVKSAFRPSKRDWFVSVDASSLNQDINNQHLIGHHNHEPLLIQPKTVQTFSNADGDSHKDVLQNDEEDRSFVDKQLAISEKIISNKRTRDVSDENLLKDPSGYEVLLKKKRKTHKVQSSVKATEDNIVSTYVGRETDADVAMVVEKNIQDGMCEKEKESELVQKTVVENEIHSSSTRTSDGGSKSCTKQKLTEKEVSLENINKDAIDSSKQDVTSNGQDSLGDLIDKLKEDSELSLKQGPEVKLPEKRKKVKKSTTKNKEQMLVMHADDTSVGNISSTILAPTVDEKVIGEKNEGIETPFVDDSKKLDEMIVNEMEISEPTNSFGNQVHVETMVTKSKNNLKDVSIRKRKKDVEKSGLKTDKLVVKQSDDVTTSVDTLHVDSVKNDNVLVNNDVEVHAEDVNDKSEKQNEIIDGVKKEKRKKKNKKSSRNEDMGPQDLLSKDQSIEVELESNKTHHLEDMSKNVIAYEVSKVNNEVDITNDRSHEISNFLDHSTPGHQLNRAASIDNEKNTKKPKKKTKDDSKNDGEIQSQKIISKNEGLEGKAKKNGESSLTGPQVRLELEKSQSVDPCHHPEDTSENVIVSEISKVNNEADIVTERSHEKNILDHFAPGQQPNKTASIDDGKDTKKPKKKKKKDDSKNTQKIISKNEGLVGLEKNNNETSEMGPQDLLSKHETTAVELEAEKSQSVDHRLHVEDTSKNVTESEVFKVNNEADITNNESHEINFVDRFAPEHQQNETASIDNGKDAKKTKKKKTKKNDSKIDGDIQSQKIISKNEVLVNVGPQDPLRKVQSTEVELESEKSQSIDHRHHVEDTFKNVSVSEGFKINNEVSITNDEYREINFLDHFAPGHQLNETASTDCGKDTKKPKKKKKKSDSKNDGDIQSQKIISKNEAVVVNAGPQDQLSKVQSTEVELESEKSQSVDHRHHVEDASKNVSVSEGFKVNNEVNITNAESHEINFLDHFAPEHQLNETASTDCGKDTKKPKKKKKSDSKNNGDIQSHKIISKIEAVVVNAGPQDQLSKVQSTEVELEAEKSQSVDHRHHVEDTFKNVSVSEGFKVNNEVNITNAESHEINFMDHFAPEHQPNETASIDNRKDPKKPKKKKNTSKNDGNIQSSKTVSKTLNNKVVTDSVISNIDQIKIPRTTRSIDSKSSSISKSFDRSYHNQKSNKQPSVVGPVKKNLPAVNSLLNNSAKIFEDDDGDNSSSDDNATVNSNSSTRTPSSNSTSSLSSGENAFSIEPRVNGSYAMNIKDGDGKKSVNSQSESKKVPLTYLLRGSNSIKKAKFSASQVGDTESQPVDFVPDSQLIS